MEIKTWIILNILFLKYIFSQRIRIDRKGRNFVDEAGRVTVFHGVNVVVKLPPYLPNTENWDPFYSLNDDDILYFKKFGFNLVRLGVLWEALEKFPGVYDYEYLEKIEDIVNKLGRNGIYVILDAHQDMFSRHFCGEGVPLFYARELYHEKECKTNLMSRFMRLVSACLPLSTFNWETEENGIPSLEACKGGFLKYHQSPELTSIYQSFYNNQNNIQDKFAEFWKILAKKFKNNSYVIGYDIWNEPWPGELWSDMRSLWPGFSDHHHVLPFYRKIDEELRKEDEDYTLMFQPVPFPDTVPFFGGKAFGGFEETPAGPNRLNRQVLNIHMYCCQARGDVCEKGEPSMFDSINICRKYHISKLSVLNKNAENLGVPLIVTEFGACSDSDACYNEMEAFLEAAENFLISWAYWMYKPYGDHTTSASGHTEGIFYDNGTPQDNKIKSLTRTYIQAYQGTPLTSKFEVESATYTSSFIYDSKVDSPTVIYFNSEYFYKNGSLISVTDEYGNNVDFIIEDERKNYFSFKINQVFGQENPVIFVKFYRNG
jgi:endoglycosylceramidase